MFFIFLVFLAAITLESLGCYISVIGLTVNTSIIMVILIISLDFSKVMISSVLYKEWNRIHWLFKIWLLPTLLFLITVTSTGTFGFLVNEFSKSTVGQEQKTVTVQLLQQEQAKLDKRKTEIDSQITQLPPNNVLQRKRLTDLFQEEITRINTRLVELDKEIPLATTEKITNSTHSGTIYSVSQALSISNEEATKFISFLITLVIDPLAIILLTIANLLLKLRKEELLSINNTPIIQESTLPTKIDTIQESLNNKSIIQDINSTKTEDIINNKPIVQESVIPIKTETIQENVNNKIINQDIITSPKTEEPIIQGPVIPTIIDSIEESFNNEPTIQESVIPTKTDTIQENVNNTPIIQDINELPHIETTEKIIENTPTTQEIINSSITEASNFNIDLIEKDNLNQNNIDSLDSIENVEDIIAELAVEMEENNKQKMYSPLMDSLKKSEKPIPKTIMEVEVKNGGFFDSNIETPNKYNFEERHFENNYIENIDDIDDILVDSE